MERFNDLHKDTQLEPEIGISSGFMLLTIISHNSLYSISLCTIFLLFSYRGTLRFSGSWFGVLRSTNAPISVS